MLGPDVVLRGKDGQDIRGPATSFRSFIEYTWLYDTFEARFPILPKVGGREVTYNVSYRIDNTDDYSA
jgi:hypothetical protein